MNKELKQLLIEHEKLINIVRCYPNIDRSTLAKYLDISLPTLANDITELKSQNIFDNKEGKNSKDSLIVNSNLGIYIGISIGGSQTKISILKMDYSVLSAKEFDDLCETCKVFHKAPNNQKFIQHDDVASYGYVYTDTPASFEDLLDTLDQILDYCIMIDKYVQSCGMFILGIGLAITGAVDNRTRKIVKAYNLKFLNERCPISLDAIISGNRISYFSDQNINISLENIAKAAAISEKYILYNQNNSENIHKDKKNIACIYLGSGIGCGLILDNKLYRGTSNFSELGHIEVRDPDFLELSYNSDKIIDELCECGNQHCLEYKIRTNVFGVSMKQFKALTSNKLCDLIMESPDKEYRLKLLGYYIGAAVNILINILNLDLIIFTGKLTALLDSSDLWRYINIAIASNKITYTTSGFSKIKSMYGALAPSVGAAICSSYSEGSEISWM